MTQKAIQEIESTNILQQFRYWANLKHNKGLYPKAFDLNASCDFVIPQTSNAPFIHDDMLVLIQNVNDIYSYAYLPYGPEIQPDMDSYGCFVENLSERLIPHLPEQCIFIRYDLPWENQWVADDASQNFTQTYFLQNTTNMTSAIAFDKELDGDIDFFLAFATDDKISFFENMAIDLDNPEVTAWPTAADIDYGQTLD